MFQLSAGWLEIWTNFERVAVAYLLTASIGWESEREAHGAGVRTFPILSEKNTFFGRYSYAGFTNVAPGAFGFENGGPAFTGIGYAGDSSVLNQSLAAGWTHTYGPTLINEFRFGYMRYHVTAVPNGVGTNPAAQAGIPGLNLDNLYTSGMPAFYIQGDQENNGPTNIGYALNVNSCNCPLTEREQQYQVPGTADGLT